MAPWWVGVPHPGRDPLRDAAVGTHDTRTPVASHRGPDALDCRPRGPRRRRPAPTRPLPRRLTPRHGLVPGSPRPAHGRSGPSATRSNTCGPPLGRPDVGAAVPLRRAEPGRARQRRSGHPLPPHCGLRRRQSLGGHLLRVVRGGGAGRHGRLRERPRPRRRPPPRPHRRAAEATPSPVDGVLPVARRGVGTPPGAGGTGSGRFTGWGAGRARVLERVRAKGVIPGLAWC